MGDDHMVVLTCGKGFDYSLLLPQTEFHREPVKCRQFDDINVGHA